MNGFDAGRLVEAKGMAALLPYLKELADGRVVVTTKGRLARFLQLEIGDVIFNVGADTVWTAEIKVESRHTGNLFLEMWSNRNFTNQKSYSERAATLGWMFHTRADLLLYYFLDTDDLYTIDVFRLKRWAFGYVDAERNRVDGRVYRFPEVVQTKNAQLNETCGRLVSIAAIRDAIGEGIKHCKVRQLSFLEEAA